MAHSGFDRTRLKFLPVDSRRSKFEIEKILVDPDDSPASIDAAAAEMIDGVAAEVRAARDRGAPVAICHGAHLIKNGLGPLLIRLVEEGWITHVATNGAGSIHDWEFGFLGRSCEDVRAYVAEGQFGIWNETGGSIGLALLLGAIDRLGYGASVGRMAAEERLVVPDPEELRNRIAGALAGGASARGARLAAMADLLAVIEEGIVAPGEKPLPHPFAHLSVQAACYCRDVPFTVHPGIGQDIIYTHPLFHGGAVGRTAMTDFLIFADMVSRLQGGVYLSVGSSVMSPMIFEKSISMARNVSRQEGASLDDFYVLVNDLAPSTWDWSAGEPPQDHPAYYVRFCKSFSRMGGRLEYLGLDNRAFLTNLWTRLRG